MPDAPFYQVLWQADRDVSGAVVSIEVEDHDRLADRAVVVLHDSNGILLNTMRPGQTLRIELGTEDLHAVIFDGFLTHVTGFGNAAAGRQARLTAIDQSILMNRTRKTRHHEGTLSSVLQTIVGEYPIPVGQVALAADPEFTIPVRQTNRTDLQFIQELALRYGARAFVEFNEGLSQFYCVSEETLATAEPAGTLGFQHGSGNLIDFRFDRLAATAPAHSAAATVDPVTGEITTTAAPVAEPVPPPAADDSVADEIASAGAARSATYESALAAAASGPGPESQYLQGFAAGLPSDPSLPAFASRRDPTRALGLRGVGIASGAINLRAKNRVTFEGVSEWANGEWYVQLARHTYQQQPPPGVPLYSTRFVVTR